MTWSTECSFRDCCCCFCFHLICLGLCVLSVSVFFSGWEMRNTQSNASRSMHLFGWTLTTKRSTNATRFHICIGVLFMYMWNVYLPTILTREHDTKEGERTNKPNVKQYETGTINVNHTHTHTQTYNAYWASLNSAIQEPVYSIHCTGRTSFIFRMACVEMC